MYPHAPGDGRERIAALKSAVKIRAEDGRPARGVDISGFMDDLPSVVSTNEFSTQSASGSTSQAVNIIEAGESGAELFLMDEDTCATNFMICDFRMQKLVHADNGLLKLKRLVDLEKIQARAVDLCVEHMKIQTGQRVRVLSPRR